MGHESYCRRRQQDFRTGIESADPVDRQQPLGDVQRIEQTGDLRPGRQIEEKDVKALVSYTQQSNIFNLVDAIMEFKANEAEIFTPATDG